MCGRSTLLDGNTTVLEILRGAYSTLLPLVATSLHYTYEYNFSAWDREKLNKSLWVLPQVCDYSKNKPYMHDWK